MVNKRFVPDRGDLVWVNLAPTTCGREQAKTRPALVVSPQSKQPKNQPSAFVSDYVSAKRLPVWSARQAQKVFGLVLADHVRSLDWKERSVTYIAQAPPQVLAEVRHKPSLLRKVGMW